MDRLLFVSIVPLPGNTLCKIKLMASRWQEAFLTSRYSTTAELLIVLLFCPSSELTSLLLLLWFPRLRSCSNCVSPFCLCCISVAVHGRKSFIAWKDMKKINQRSGFLRIAVASSPKVKALAWPLLLLQSPRPRSKSSSSLCNNDVVLCFWPRTTAARLGGYCFGPLRILQPRCGIRARAVGSPVHLEVKPSDGASRCYRAFVILTQHIPPTCYEWNGVVKTRSSTYFEMH